MPFLTEIDLRNDKVDESNWIVLSELRYQSRRENDVVIIVPQGFVSDLSSVPRLPLVYALFGGRGNGPAIVHDWCYRTGCREKGAADLLFLDGMKDIGLSWWIRDLMYMGVKYGGYWTYKGYVKDRAEGHSPWEVRDVEPFIQ